MKIAKNISQLIGNTPILQLNNINNNIYAKCEFTNPTSSIKDRAAYNMINKALKKKIITKKTHIIEPTSGNTGIALASICASMNMKLTLVMPESMSIERQKLMKFFGANVVLTKASLGMAGSIKKAKQLQKNNKNAIILDQFSNKLNPQAHKQTAYEILQTMGTNIDIFITSVGTGGTLNGVAKELKKKIPNLKIIAIEPKNSAVLSGKKASLHKIQGIGAGFIPKNLDINIIDEIVLVKDKDALNMAKKLAKKEGLLVGISSGANIYGANKISKKYKNKKIITFLCDTAERYLTSELF